MRAEGPLAYSRHPLNWLLIPLFWFQPRMYTRLLKFNLVLTAYVVVGSVAAEAHTLRAYGEAYQGYREQVPFVVGGTVAGLRPESVARGGGYTPAAYPGGA